MQRFRRGPLWRRWTTTGSNFREVRVHMCKGKPNDCEVPADLRVAAEEVNQYVAEQEHALHDGTLAAVKPRQLFCRGAEDDSGHDHWQ